MNLKESLNYEIANGKIKTKLNDIDVDIVPFRGRNGIFLSIRSQSLVDIAKSILLIENISMSELLEEYNKSIETEDSKRS